MTFYLASVAILLLAALTMGVWAIAFTLTPPKRRQNRRSNLCGSTAAALACLIGFAGMAAGPWDFASLPETANLAWGLPFGGFALLLDPVSRIFLLPVFGLGFVCALSGSIALRHERASEHNIAAHWFFYLLLLLGMALVACAADAILFLLAWEIMSLSPFFLIDFNDRDSTVRDASWTYLVAAHLGAVFLLAFFVGLWQATGITSLNPAALAPGLADAGTGVVSLLFILAVAGFGAKAGIAPMHVWLPDAHPAAPSHISALLSGAMINLGLYGVIRTISLLAGPAGSIPGIIGAAPAWWGWLLLLIGLCTALVGILKALAQGNLKRMLAYSSVENMGLMFTALGCGLLGASCGDAWAAFLGFSGALLHMLNHAGFKGLLFLCAGEVLHSAGTLRMELLGGLQKRMPLTGCLFALGAFSIACLPPFSGFTGEFAIFVGLANGASAQGVEQQLGLLLSLGLLALVSGFACALYVKAYGMVFLGRPRTGFAANAHAPGLAAIWPLLIPAAACVAGGLLAPLFFRIVSGPALGAAPLAGELLDECLVAATAILPSFWHIALLGWLVAIAVTGLWLARKRLLAGRSVRICETWGCGYQASSARIQYSEGSFSEPLARLFNPVMGIVRHGEPVSGVFPKPSSLGLSAPDRVKDLLLTPLFEGIEWLCNACKIIQHGKINLYILYIIATVVCLLIWGLK